MNEHSILKHLDSPIRILSFDAKDLALLLLPLIVGAFFDSILLFSSVGWCLIFFVKKALKRAPKFYLVRLLYRKLPTERLNRFFKWNLPSSHKKMWVK